MSTSVPTVESLADIYPPSALPAQTKRWTVLLSQFQARFGRPAEFVARSPGRVNIIGEHIDYSLYSVLPMAITADCLLAVATMPSDGADDGFRIDLANVDDAYFPARDFTVPHAGEVVIDAGVHEWSNYFKSGLRGAVAALRRRQGDGEETFRCKSMCVLMDGSVPAGGGLSSSAAFTSTSALSVMVANGEREVDKTELTELAIVSERAVGVNSGGMDQSASVFSRAGSALFVSFTPTLTATPVSVPPTSPELTFLIAQSFVAADKHVTGPVNYNLRVVECTLAAAYLHAVLNTPGAPLPGDASPLGISLHGFHETYFAARRHQGQDVPDTPAGELAELEKLAEQTFTHEAGYTRDEIADVLGTSVADLNEKYTSRFPVRAERFKLRQRAVHVFSEARRVLELMALLAAPPAATADGSTQALNTALGALLDASHASCAQLFECSCPELDALCDVARRAGAYGSRLTGAGWGGCCVNLVPADRVEAVREAWEREYYGKMDLTAEQREVAVVVSRPGSGSAVYVVEGDSL